MIFALLAALGLLGSCELLSSVGMLGEPDRPTRRLPDITSHGFSI